MKRVRNIGRFVLDCVESVLASSVGRTLGVFLSLGGLVLVARVTADRLLAWELPVWRNAVLVLGLLVVGHLLWSNGLVRHWLSWRSVGFVLLHLVSAVGVVVATAGLVGGWNLAFDSYAAESFPVWGTLQAVVYVAFGGWVARVAHKVAR